MTAKKSLLTLFSRSYLNRGIVLVFVIVSALFFVILAAISEGKIEGKTIFVTTRFGNVLGSNGSVIGLFRQKRPELDMISVGPTMLYVHSPAERLEVASVGKFWDYILDILKRAPKAGK